MKNYTVLLKMEQNLNLNKVGRAITLVPIHGTNSKLSSAFESADNEYSNSTYV